MNAADRVRLRHMLDAAREALSFVKDRKREDLSTDRMLVLSLVKEIEIIGEAASQVSSHLQQSTPAIPWAKIVGMRNRLIHAYSDVNIQVVWSTVVSDLPSLVTEIEELLARDE